MTLILQHSSSALVCNSQLMDGTGKVPEHLQGKRKKANKQNKRRKRMTDKNNDSDQAVSMTSRDLRIKFREHVNFSRTPEFSVSCKQVKLCLYTQCSTTMY
jgi:hypothetical protein